MKPLLIVYFSGVGNTEKTAVHIKKCAGTIPMEIYSAEKLPEHFSIENYSAVIIGTPTYHSEPAMPIMKFLAGISADHAKPAFIFTTCGLYSENCLRTLAMECLKHGIIPIHSASYRCSATDGILIAPFMEYWFTDEKKLYMKINEDLCTFLRKLRNHSKACVPNPKWYTALNYPNKMLGKAAVFPIYLHKNACIKCGKCVRNCPQNAISIIDGYPIISKSECMNCYRCIHHCPALALSLFKNKALQKVWSK